jgi:hypothetical protein
MTLIAFVLPTINQTVPVQCRTAEVFGSVSRFNTYFTLSLNCFYMYSQFTIKQIILVGDLNCLILCQFHVVVDLINFRSIIL